MTTLFISPQAITAPVETALETLPFPGWGSYRRCPPQRPGLCSGNGPPHPIHTSAFPPRPPLALNCHPGPTAKATRQTVFNSSPPSAEDEKMLGCHEVRTQNPNSIPHHRVCRPTLCRHASFPRCVRHWLHSEVTLQNILPGGCWHSPGAEWR